MPLNINPWTHIWLHPKKTMREILNWNPRKRILIFAILGGILSAVIWLGIARLREPREMFHNVLYIILLLISGAIVGIAHLYFAGAIYSLTGSWIGGKGSFSDVKCAVGWSYYPFILANIFSILNLWSLPNPWLQFIFGLLNFIIFIWGLVIFFHLLAEAHRFSLGKAVLAVLIALILIFVVLMIVMLLVPLLSPLFSNLRNLI